nr:hypothetical protein [Candidatus Omnitrophota bacterium]
PGGIDFRSIPLTIQPLGSFSTLHFNLPKVSTLNINLDKELADIERMVKAGIVPSGERLKEYIALCYQAKAAKSQLDALVPTLMSICKLQEVTLTAADAGLQEVLVLVDAQ